MKIRLTATLPSAVVLIAGLLAPALPAENRLVIPGQIHPKIQLGADMGRVDPALNLAYVTIVLKPSPSQQADLNALLAQQQNPASPNFHRWLTPEQYAERFGASRNDLDAIAAWLKGQNLTVLSTARGRNAIAFRGTARQIETAFSTEIHHYQVGGELHFANATNPSVPALFAPKIAAIHGLNDFHPKPAARRVVRPEYNVNGQHRLGPADLATIYDIAPLYQNGINGSGQVLAVAGQTNVHLFDIEEYRKLFSLPANDPTLLLVPQSADPGYISGDLTEADLDLEVSGAIAPNAKILFVYSSDVFDSVQYIIDQDLAPVLTVSYGSCELETPNAETLMLQIWAQQANAEGITWFASAGDYGGADCYQGGDGATDLMLSADVPAAIPEVTGVGGTEFNEGSTNYWSTSNGAGEESARSYIPEIVWNDSTSNRAPASGGGGASTVFSKPVWQAGPGVPADKARDVPDVALAASAEHDGYQIYTGGSFIPIGGTSAGAPAFAGIATLLNQYLVANGVQAAPGLGNINPTLYALAQTPGDFHDVTGGNNLVDPCQEIKDCKSGLIGYNAGPGYDQASGLGSVDVYNLATSWTSAVLAQSAVSMSLVSSAANVSYTGSAVMTATVTSSTGTPTGSASFSLGGTPFGTASLAAGTAGSATATVNMPGILLSAGSNAVLAAYSGDSSHLPMSAVTSVTAPAASTALPHIGGITDAASFKLHFAPGGLISVFGTNLSPATGGAPFVPLPNSMAGVSADVNGVPVPLWFISPDQMNVQLPYETVPGLPATLTVNNNGQTATFSFTVDAVAPGIFTFDNGAPVPYTTAKRGDVITLYMSGLGAVTPAIADGAAPPVTTPLADLPVPVQGITVTVGGVNANLPFAGIPYYLVGVGQVNYQIPQTAPLGMQPVIVSVGTVNSVPAMLNITD